MKAWENYIRKVEPYIPGEQLKVSGMIKLNTNENPYPPSMKVKLALEEFRYENLKLYPDPQASILINALARHYTIEQDMVFVGVGSDDVLAMAFLTFFNSKEKILFPNITYSFYEVWADLFQIPYEKIPLDPDFKIVKEDYYRRNGGVVLANPNAPTSIYEDISTIRDILEHNKDSIVIIDEAYIDFGGVSAIELLPDYDNLLVVQTFSKSRSMAGMRIGYAIGSNKLIKALHNVKNAYNSYTMNETSLCFGVKSLEDNEHFSECLDKIIKTRDYVKAELSKLGFSFPDSKTNFIFAKHTSIPAIIIYEKLREKKVFVRYFNKPLIDNYIRITIGTRQDMDIVLQILHEIVYNA